MKLSIVHFMNTAGFFIYTQIVYYCSMNYEEKYALLSDLITLAKADNKVTSEEYDFICRLADRMHVLKEEVDQLFHNPRPSKPIFSEMERITHFHKLLLLMNVDREAHPQEVVALKNFGLRMGIRPGVIDQILLKQESYPHKIIPPEELLKIFQTYYN